MNALNELQTFALAWYNLPFTLALLAFLGMSALQFIDLDQDHHLEADGDLDLDPDLESDLEPEPGGILGWSEILQFLGVGQVPITIVLVLLLGGFGLIGWVANSLILHFLADYPVWAILPVVVLALNGGSWFTARAARVLGRALPAFATSATPAERLVSRRGYVASAQVDERYGSTALKLNGETKDGSK